ncbi:hypothetical protein D3C76_1804280 [compost metagenome]
MLHITDTALDRHVPGMVINQTCNQVENGALTAAARSNDRDEFAAVQVKGNIFNDFAGTVMFPDTTQ